MTASPEERARASVDDVEARVASVPGLVRTLLASPPPLPSLAGVRDVAVTGIGAAAGPARHLASLLPGARFVPVSAFVTGGPARGRTLVVFSQHLSPNARLVLARSADAARVVVVTSAAEDEVRALAPAAEVVRLAPEQERGMLLRVAGPAVALVAATLLARAAGVAIDEAALARMPDVLASSASRFAAAVADAGGDVVGSALDGPLSIVTCGDAPCAARAVAWKLLEGWSVPEPPVRDVLDVAHGPFQQLHRGRACLVALVARDAAVDALLARLAAMLVPARHTLLVLRAELPPPLAAVELDALANRLLLAGRRARPRDLRTWDGQGADGPLYDLDR